MSAQPAAADVSNDELTKRHSFSSKLVSASITVTLILVALAIAGLRPKVGAAADPTLLMAMRIAIPFFGLGAVVVRRVRFNSTRLIDTAAVRGQSGLLASLQKTVVIVVALALAMVAMGYLITATQSGDPQDTILPGIAALAILIFTYPRRVAWQRLLQITNN